MKIGILERLIQILGWTDMKIEFVTVKRSSSVDEGSGNKKEEAKQRGAAGFRDMGLESGVPITLSAELFSAAAKELNLRPSRLFWNTEIVDST